MSKPIENFCPFIKKECIKHECKFYVHVSGTDRNSGKEIDRFDCAIVFLPMMLIEVAGETRGVIAATESFRNVMKVQNDTIKNVLVAGMNRANQLKEANGSP